MPTQTSADAVRKKKRLEDKRAHLQKESRNLERDAAKVENVPALNSEASFKAEYARMLRYNSKLIRRMNQQLEGSLSSRDIYALSTLMSQQREVINDLRAIADLSQQVNLIYDQSVNPFMSDLTQLITDVYYQLRKLIMETSKPKESSFALSQLDELIKQIGLGMQTSHGVLRQSIERILVGEPRDTVKTKKRSRMG